MIRSQKYTVMKILLGFVAFVLAIIDRYRATELKYVRTQVTPDVFPYVVVIPHTNDHQAKAYCSGTILNDFWVLTSATCAKNMSTDFRKNSLVVYAYASSSIQPWNRFKQKRLVVEMLTHPKNTRGNLEYNQAVLGVQDSFVFDENFTRAKVYRTDLKLALKGLLDMMFEFRQRRCTSCKQPDFGKYDCKMVSWKMKSYDVPHLRLMEVTLLGYDECDKINTEFNVFHPSRIVASVCVQPKRIDIVAPQGSEQLSPPEFYESADEGAPLICGEAGTERYKLWGTYSTPMYSRSNNTEKSKVVYVYFTSIESLLYGYNFHRSYL